MRKYRLTLLFALTAITATTLAAITVNRVIGGLAEDNLVRIAQENTARDSVHMEAMMRRGDSMAGMSSSGVMTDVGNGMQGMQQPAPLTLEYLTGPEGLSRTFPHLVEGLSIVKSNIFDLNGTTVWSTDDKTIAITKRETPFSQRQQSERFRLSWSIITTLSNLMEWSAEST